MRHKVSSQAKELLNLLLLIVFTSQVGQNGFLS